MKQRGATAMQKKYFVNPLEFTAALTTVVVSAVLACSLIFIGRPRVRPVIHRHRPVIFKSFPYGRSQSRHRPRRHNPVGFRKDGSLLYLG